MFVSLCGVGAREGNADGIDRLLSFQEFILVDNKVDKPALVVRALTVPFEQEDFEEFSVSVS